jgi:hypothetical protein
MANNNIYAASIFSKNPTAMWALDEDFYKTSNNAIVAYTGTISDVSGSGPYLATLTVPNTALFQVGLDLAATDGTGSLGSGVITVTDILNTTSVSISSTATMSVGTVTNIYYEIPLENLSTTINISAYGLRARAFGTNNDYDGFYLSTSEDADFDDLKANNYGVPLVFGAATATNIYPNPDTSSSTEHNDPSLIVPGFGFLNSEGRYKTLTLEMWLKINSSSHYPRRIVGPIASTDGLYVNGPFLSLKIGKTIGHHYVGEWARPMLLDIFYTSQECGLILNGERVLSIFPEDSDREFPEKYTLGLENDWIGFYAYENVSPIQIDCIAVYPFRVSEIEAKVSFIKGQAVEQPQKKNRSFSDVPLSIDFQYSKNSNTYSYPGTGNWQSGISTNMKAQYSNISVPEYALPGLNIKDQTKTVGDWNDFHKNILSPVETLDAGSIIDTSSYFMLNDSEIDVSEDYAKIDSQAYLMFDPFALVKGSTSGFYATLKMPTTLSNQTVVKIYNSQNQSFEINIVADTTSSIPTATLQYAFKVNGEIAETFSATEIYSGDYFGVGINIEEILSANTDSQYLKTFFMDTNSLKMMFGGTDKYSDSFAGRVYRIGFFDASTYGRVSSYFSDGIFSIPDSESSMLLINEVIVSYTLFMNYIFGEPILDIACYGSFSDYVPLSTLAKPALSSSGDLVDTIDSIHFGIGFPNYDYQNAIVKSFFRLRGIPTSLYVDYETTTDIGDNGLIVVPSGWQNDRYVIKDGDVVSLPESISLSDYAFEIDVEFEIPGIIRNPISLSNMLVSSFAINKNTGAKDGIGTRDGKDMYLVSVDNDYNNPTYTSFNQFAIYKDSSPYLYMTSQSGIKNAGTITGTNGIEIPLNESGADNYIVSVMQMSILKQSAFSTEEEICRINAWNEYNSPTRIVIYAGKLDDGGYVGNIYAKYHNADGTYSDCNDISIHINGVEYGTDAFGAIRINEWAVLSISFTNFLYFSNHTDGNMRVFGEFLINNVSAYQLMPYQVGKSRSYRTWSSVGETIWDDWDNGETGLWTMVWVSGSQPVDGLSLENIYNSYFGSSVIESNDDSSGRFVFYPAKRDVVISSESSRILKKPL